MKNDQKVPGFITLTNGYVLRADVIYAVRPLEESETSEKKYPPRVVVDFSPTGVQEANCCVLDCANNAERDRLVVDIMLDIKIGREALRKEIS